MTDFWRFRCTIAHKIIAVGESKCAILFSYFSSIVPNIPAKCVGVVAIVYHVRLLFLMYVNSLSYVRGHVVRYVAWLLSVAKCH